MTALRRLFATALVVGLVAPSLPLRAQTQEQFKFMSGSGVGYNGVQVGPYRGMLLSEPGTPTIDIYCVDYLHEVHLNDVWTANISNLTGSLTGTRLYGAFNFYGSSAFYGTDNVLDRYRKAAWLTTQFAIQNTTAWGGIHSAIWLLTTPNPTSTLSASMIAAAGYWITQATNSFMSLDFSKFAVATDVYTDANGQSGIQEYIVDPPFTVTPEPATVLLLGTGLAGVYAARRRKKAVPVDG